MTKREDAARDRVRQTAQAVKEAKREHDRALAARARAMKSAANAGIPSAEVAKLAGVSPGLVSRSAPRRVTREPAATAAPKVAAVPSLADDLSVCSATTVCQVRPYGERRTISTRTTERTSLRSVLSWAGSWHGDRALLCGPREHLEAGTATGAGERVRAWFLDVPDGWRVADAGCYLEDVDAPVGRYTHVEFGRTVEVMRAAQWFGEDATDHLAVMRAWDQLDAWAQATFPGGRMLSTPATTGRDLFARTVPRSGFPVLHAGLRELIGQTAGQGRVQTFPEHAGRLPGFAVYDGRFFYAAHTWGLPVGGPAIVRSAAPTSLAANLHYRGRWRATVSLGGITAGTIGPLPIRSDMGNWTYPTYGVHEGWWDSVELRHAIACGAHVTLHEGFTQREGKPLNAWTKALRDLYEQAPDPLVRKAARAMLLHTLGAFATRGGTVTRYGTPDEADAASGRRVGGVSAAGVGADGTSARVTWQETRAQSAWAESMSHPEWSATVWARARVAIARAAMLAQEDGARVLAIRTDAVYLDRRMPGWKRSDAPIGALRLQEHVDHPVEWDGTATGLLALREQATA